MRRAALLFPILLAACTPNGDDTESGSSGSSSGLTTPTTPTTATTATTATSTATTTGELPTTGESASTGGPTTPGASASTGADASTGEPGTATLTTTGNDGTTGIGESTGAPVDPNVNIDPSQGMGGAIAPGTSSMTPMGAEIYIPSSYAPEQLASPVIWLFNEKIAQWSATTDPDAAILVDLHEYNDTQKIVAKLNETIEILEAQYNVDRGRYYWAGWSAGGNLVIIIGSQNQDTLAGTMVFPGTGGNIAQQPLAEWNGHKIRMYYACGSADPNFDANAVKFEAETWMNKYGYTTRFDLIDGGPHYLDEAIYHPREAAWAWMRGFNLEN